MTTTESTRTRVGWIDGARGLSVAAMMFSHLDLVVGAPLGWVFHSVIMRPVAPVFLLLLALLWRQGWRRRHWQLVLAAPMAQGLATLLGFAVPNILLVILGGVLVLPIVQRWPVPVTIAAVTQLVFWPLPEWWTGYPVGFVLVLLVVGRHVRVDGFLEGYGRVGSRLGLEFVGRHPLSFYLGHLAGLVLLVLVAS